MHICELFLAVVEKEILSIYMIIKFLRRKILLRKLISIHAVITAKRTRRLGIRVIITLVTTWIYAIVTIICPLR